MNANRISLNEILLSLAGSDEFRNSRNHQKCHSFETWDKKSIASLHDANATNTTAADIDMSSKTHSHKYILCEIKKKKKKKE